MKIILQFWIIWAFKASSSEMMAVTVMVNFPSELLDSVFLDMEISLALHVGWSTVIKIIFCLTNEKISPALG